MRKGREGREGRCKFTFTGKWPRHHLHTRSSKKDGGRQAARHSKPWQDVCKYSSWKLFCGRVYVENAALCTMVAVVHNVNIIGVLCRIIPADSIPPDNIPI